MDALGEGFDGQGFCEPRDALEQDVAVGKEADEKAFNQLLLPDHHAGNFFF